MGYRTIRTTRPMTLTFGSTIRFVSAERFREENVRLMHKPMLREWDWGAKQFQLGQRGTDCIANCIGGGLTNTADAAPFHLQPLSDNVYAPMDAQFSTSAIRLEGTRPSPKAVLSGFMMGGHNLVASMHGPKLFEKLRGLFERAGIPLSYFVGTLTRGSCDMIYDADKDTWLVTLRDNGQPYQPRSVDELKRRYQHVNIEPTDTLKFGD